MCHIWWISAAFVVAFTGLARADSVPTPASDDIALGKPDAPVTIFEFASLTCPHCAHFDVDVLPKLKEKWIDSGKARLVMRDFPLNKVDVPAALVARCMPPARFYPFVDTLYHDQDNWVMAKDYKAALQRMAQLAGLGAKQVTACLDDKAAEDSVLQGGLIASQQLGVNSTPTFFINGTKFEGDPTFEAFDQLLSGLAAKS
jgi:protein-disulfide isomerase